MYNIYVLLLLELPEKKKKRPVLPDDRTSFLSLQHKLAAVASPQSISLPPPFGRTQFTCQEETLQQGSNLHNKIIEMPRRVWEPT